MAALPPALGWVEPVLPPASDLPPVPGEPPLAESPPAPEVTVPPVAEPPVAKLPPLSFGCSLLVPLEHAAKVTAIKAVRRNVLVLIDVLPGGLAAPEAGTIA